MATKKTTRPMTKSALTVARQALAVARDALPPYHSKFSRKDYTQHQLFALLAVRPFLKTDYRGVEQLARDWSDLRQTLGLTRVPDHSTLGRAGDRLRKKKPPTPCGVPPSRPPVAAGRRSRGWRWTRPGSTGGW